ncbi:MAG: hypothetical protein ABW082_03155 [Sedimenticola sp.]
MKDIKDMNRKELRSFYKSRIAQHTPQKNRYDRMMFNIYRHLLDNVDRLQTAG